MPDQEPEPEADNDSVEDLIDTTLPDVGVCRDVNLLLFGGIPLFFFYFPFF